MILLFHDWAYARVPEAINEVFGLPIWFASIAVLCLIVVGLYVSVSVVEYLDSLTDRDENA